LTLRARIARINLKSRYLEGERRNHSWLEVIMRLLRVHQWLKNVLVFVPVVLSHRVLSPGVLGHAAVAFAAFSCCASATYIVNDLLDLEADRQHAQKRKRPLASGLISIPAAVLMAIALLLCAAGFATMLPYPAIQLLIIYFAITVLYSAWLKRVVLVDAFVLAALYSLRVLGGGAATGIVVSAWTIAFFMFLFLSLALLKRYAEMMAMASGVENDRVRGRGYHRTDIGFVSQCGVASGLVAVLVFALYLHSPEVHALYKRPDILWLLSPILAYGTLSMWLAGHRGEMDEDPILFAAKKPSTYILGAIGAVVILAASI
jgi:4-hydroxybenzoate polyprenyltransferase